MKLATKILLFSLVATLIISIVAFFILAIFPPVIVLALCLVVLSIAIYVYLQFLFKDLLDAVQKLKQINVKRTPHTFGQGKFRELNELSAELNAFSQRNNAHYLSQKRYSENLSHELLTPLAIIRTKAELLLQAPDLREVDLLHLDSIIQTVGRLSNLNKGLILLSKIDNRQFVDAEDLLIAELVRESLENFEDQIRKKHLSISVDLAPDVHLFSNTNLMRILIANLIKNAIFHNIEQGYVTIQLTSQFLRIENTGLPNEKDPNLFFQRFVSDNNTEHSIGLGLAIVKEICLVLGFEITYESEDSLHILNLKFKP